MEQRTFSILITDDDAGDRKQLKRTLKKTDFDCQVYEAASTQEAISLCEQHAFDCTIIDYYMPGDDVIEGVKNINERFPHMPIIMVSGQGDEIVASEAFKAGVLDYIPKRIVNVENLNRTISNALDKSSLQKKVETQRQALENYAHILAHDLQAPIRQINSFIEIISDDIKQHNFNDIEEHFSYIEKSGKNILHLIEALSAHNSIDTGQIYFTNASLHDILENTLHNIGLLIKEKNAKITYDQNLPELTCNSAELAQLFQNLISNGIKYNRQKTPEIHIAAQELDNAWQFSITDNGIGIPKEHQEKIFDMFKRLHGSGQGFEGSGIGLATCSKIVERHNGKIWCESEEEKGATFSLIIPKEINASKTTKS